MEPSTPSPISAPTPISTPTPHPYHYWEDKSFIQHLIDWALPIALLLLYFFFYNFGKFNSSEMIKTTGLTTIALLSITLMVGPIGRFIPSLNILKAHRKFWGITSFLLAILHMSLVLIFDHLEFSDLPGVAFGLTALLILLLVVISSNHRVITRLHPGVWKKLQTTSYIALTLAVVHFYIMEQQSGVLVIKRSLGKVTFWFATVVILLRLIVYFFPKKDEAQAAH